MLGSLARALEELGFQLRGGFAPSPGDAVPGLGDGSAARTVVLVGSIGPELWRRLEAAPERHGPDPVDRYTRRTIGTVAAGFGATAVFPFDGPPWYPFQRWAVKAEPGLRASPLG